MPGITGFVLDCQDWTSFDSRVAKARSSMAEVAMRTWDQLALGRTTALRRQPARSVKAGASSGYTESFELICCDCGDHPLWTTVTSHSSFSGSVDPTPSRRASPPTRACQAETPAGSRFRSSRRCGEGP
jgi:hypothetical protein